MVKEASGLAVVKDRNGETAGAHIDLRKKMYQEYVIKVSKKNTEKFNLEKRTNDAILSVVAWSLLQVYLLYLRTDCKSNKCPYLYICPKAIRESPCKYATSHDVTDFHNVLVLRQYDLKPHKGMSIDFVRCSILVLKEQKRIKGCKYSSVAPIKKGSGSHAQISIVTASPPSVAGARCSGNATAKSSPSDSLTGAQRSNTKNATKWSKRKTKQ